MRSLPVIISGLLLGLFGVLGAAMVGVSHEFTAERIAHSEREALLELLHALVPPETADNDLANDVIEVTAPDQLGAATTRVYRARRGGEPVAAVFSPVVTQGYSGAIQLIVAVRADGSLAGVRVLSHHETPGLGDKIEPERSDWIRAFDGRSLEDPAPSRWKVKRDGGVFDQFTGATITPRAVVRGVRATLEYYAQNGQRLFETALPANGGAHE